MWMNVAVLIDVLDCEMLLNVYDALLNRHPLGYVVAMKTVSIDEMVVVGNLLSESMKSLHGPLQMCLAMVWKTSMTMTAVLTEKFECDSMLWDGPM